MALETLRDLFINELRDMYHAEKQLVRALPMAKAADSDALRQAIEKHLGETEGHVKRLESVFRSLGETVRAKRCRAWRESSRRERRSCRRTARSR